MWSHVVTFTSKFAILIGEGFHITLKLRAEKQSKQNPWEDGNPHVLSEELWSHFQAVKERLSVGKLNRNRFFFHYLIVSLV